MAGNYQPPPRKKNALDEYKLRLSAAPVQGGTRPPSLAFSVVGNQPRIDVYTNVPNDKQNGNIRAAMDMFTFWAMIEALKVVIEGAPGEKLTIPNKNHVWFDGKRSDEPKLISNTIVGKDKEGVVFISVIAKDRPYIKFSLLPTLYHSLVKSDGSEMSPAEISVFYAKGFVNHLPQLVASVADTNYEEPKPKEDKGGGNRGGGGGGGGNYQNRGGGGNSGGGGGGRSNDFEEDDFPM